MIVTQSVSTVNIFTVHLIFIDIYDDTNWSKIVIFAERLYEKRNFETRYRPAYVATYTYIYISHTRKNT